MGNELLYFGCFCIIHCYFNAFIGFCVVFCIYEHVLNIFLGMSGKMSQKCEQFSYELFLRCLGILEVLNGPPPPSPSPASMSKFPFGRKIRKKISVYGMIMIFMKNALMVLK